MNKLKYLIIASVFFGAIACTNFLDQQPQSAIPDGINDNSVTYIDQPTAEGRLQAAYDNFGNTNYWQLDVYILNDIQTTECYGGEQSAATQQIDKFSITSDNHYVEEVWSAMYSQIGAANKVIDPVESSPDSLYSDLGRKVEMVAEARAIRAICYFNLIRIYGNIPLVLHPIPKINQSNIDSVYPQLYPNQTSPDSVYTQIITDLTYALAHVSDYSSTKFKITKPLVNLLLAQVYATKDGNTGANWAEVKKYSQAVVNDGNYNLLTNYDDLFAPADGNPIDGNLSGADLANENSSESLFEVDYNGWNSGDLGNWAAYMFYGHDWKKYCIPSHDLVNAFTNAGDTVRLKSSISFETISSWTDPNWPTTNYPFAYKLRSGGKGNIILFRYAEAVLLQAEAENELGNTSVATGLVNQIRSRAHLANTTATTQDQLRAEIENEYRLEFAFEGKLWFDMKRRGDYLEVMQNTVDAKQADAQAHLNQNRLVWPIPQQEVDMNQNLVQNPGY